MTRRRKMRQNGTEWHPRPKQRLFVEALLSDDVTTVTQAAERAGVSRSSVYRWFNDPDFNAYLRHMREMRARSWAARIDQSLIREALAGDVQAIKLFYEKWEDLRSGGDVNVNVNTITIDPETAREEILNRLNLGTTEEPEA